MRFILGMTSNEDRKFLKMLFLQRGTPTYPCSGWYNIRLFPSWGERLIWQNFDFISWQESSPPNEADSCKVGQIEAKLCLSKSTRGLKKMVTIWGDESSSSSCAHRKPPNALRSLNNINGFWLLPMTPVWKRIKVGRIS